MKALQFVNNGLRVSDVPVPNIASEALVRVVLSGICNTDLEIVRGYAGFQGTIGHEFVGVVEESEDSPGLIGRRVVGEINAGCGICDLCRAGDPRHCGERTVLGIKERDGAHAEFLRLPSRNLLEVPDSVSDDEAVFTEPLAAALGIAERIELASDERVAVIGDGKLGILCAWGIAATGRHSTLIGKHLSKLTRSETEGVETVLTANASGLSRQFDVVVEASGSESGFSRALDLLRPRGTLILKSTFQGRPTWEASRVVVDEITIVGSRCGRFKPALSLLADRKADVRRLIDEEYGLSEGVRAMKRASDSGILKVLLRP